MNMLQKIGGTIRNGIARMAQKTVSTLASWTQVGFFSDLSANWKVESYNNLARLGIQNPYVKRTTELIAANLAQIPFVLVRENEDGSRDVERTHQLLELLENPNPMQSGHDFLQEIIYNLMFGGEFFPFKKAAQTGPNAGIPREIHLARPDRFERFIYDEMGIPEAAVFNVRAGSPRGRSTLKPKKFTLRDNGEPGEMAQGKLYHPLNDERGLAILVAAFKAVQIMRQGSNWNLSTFKNKGRVPGIFTYEGPGNLSDDQFERLKKENAEVYDESSAKGRAMSVPDDWAFTEMGQKLSDAEMVDVMQEEARRITIGIGGFPSLVGDSDNKTYSNFSTALLALHILTILPHRHMIQGVLNRWIIPQFDELREEGWRLGFVAKDIRALEPRRKDRAERLQMATGDTPWMSPDEARRQDNMDTRGGAAEDIWTAFNKVPLESAAAGGTGGGNESTRALLRMVMADDEKFHEWLEDIRNPQKTGGGDGAPADPSKVIPEVG